MCFGSLAIRGAKTGPNEEGRGGKSSNKQAKEELGLSEDDGGCHGVNFG